MAIDHDRKNLEITANNFNLLAIDKNHYQILKASIFALPPNLSEKASLCFIDLPYHITDYQRLFSNLSEHHWLADKALVICELARKNALSSQFSAFKLVKQYLIGKTQLLYFNYHA